MSAKPGQVHTSIPENYRKDFEKLLREGVPGLWFHTLASASDRAWRVIEQHVIEAFERVKDHAHGASHTVHFAFRVLDEPMMIEFDVELSGKWQSKLTTHFQVARQAATPPAWFVPPIVRSSGELKKSIAGPQRAGPRQKSLIFAPSLDPYSFVHLNDQGESYCLRTFGGTNGLTARKRPECPTTSELRAQHQIEIPEQPVPQSTVTVTIGNATRQVRVPGDDGAATNLFTMRGRPRLRYVASETHPPK